MTRIYTLAITLLLSFGCHYGDSHEHHGCDPWPWPDDSPAVDAAPKPDVDCSHCDDGTPDPPDGGSACPGECEGPF